MKRFIYLIIVVFAIFSCEKEEMVEYINSNEANDITEINLYANSNQLFADGNSTLSFLYKAYGEVQVIEYIELNTEGDYKDTLVTKTFEFKDGRLPEGSIKIYTEDGTEIDGKSFSTTSNADSIKFYAEGGGIRSDLIAVALQPAPQDNFPQITIPVIFHLVSNNSNKYAINNVTSEYLAKKIDRLNQVMAGTLAPSPHSIDAKVKFEMASTGPQGAPLAETGINRVNAGDREGLEINDFVTANHVWDPNKYLNIYISDWYYERWGWAYSTSFESLPPRYITTSASELPYPKKVYGEPRSYTVTPLTEVDDLNQPYESATDVGIAISTDALFAQDNEVSFEFMFGTFFGVFPTRYRSSYYTPLKDADNDFCSDTHIYYMVWLLREKWIYQAKTPTSTSAVEVTPRYYYESYNIMDQYSSATTITYEQVKRLRAVLEYCPHRQFRK